MKNKLFLLFLSIAFAVSFLVYKSKSTLCLTFIGILMGIVGIIYSIVLLTSKTKRANLTIAILLLCWGVICLIAFIPISRGCVRFVIKKFYMGTYDAERIYFVFNDYVENYLGGEVSFAEDWKQILSEYDWYIDMETFKISEQNNSYLVLNSKVIGEDIKNIPSDIVLFFEKSGYHASIGSDADFSTQNLQDNDTCLIVLANGRQVIYYKEFDGYRFFNTETQKTDYKPLIWQKY